MNAYVQVGQSTTSPIANTQRKEVRLDIYVGANGYVQNAEFKQKPIAALEKGLLTGPVAIVMHRTASSNSASVFSSFEAGKGTHFVVDKDGTIYQTASLFKYTQHVGKIKSRCKEEGTCPAAEMASLKKMSVSARYNHEKVKFYPARYSINEDSVGIETVAKYNLATTTWDAATPEQSASIKRLVGILKDEYGLSDADIYEHDKISHKTPGEGADLYDIEPAPPIVQPRFPIP